MAREHGRDNQDHFSVERLVSSLKGIIKPDPLRNRFEVEGKLAYDTTRKSKVIQTLSEIGGEFESDEFIDTHYVLFGNGERKYGTYSFRLRKMHPIEDGKVNWNKVKREVTIKGPRVENDHLKIKLEIEADLLEEWPEGTPEEGHEILREDALVRLSQEFGPAKKEKVPEDKRRITYFIPHAGIRVAFETVYDAKREVAGEYIEFEALAPTADVAITNLTNFITSGDGQTLGRAAGIVNLTTDNLSPLSTAKFIKQQQALAGQDKQKVAKQLVAV